MLQVQMCGCPCLICASDIGFNWKCFFICVAERLKGICVGVNFCSSVAKILRYLLKYILISAIVIATYFFASKTATNVDMTAHALLDRRALSTHYIPAQPDVRMSQK